jgi:hypothetical protein
MDDPLLDGLRESWDRANTILVNSAARHSAARSRGEG